MDIIHFTPSPSQNQIDVIFTFLSEQRAPLAEFYRDYCINHKAAIKIRGMSDFEQALTQIGICLVMRQVSDNAQSLLRSWAPKSLHSTLVEIGP